MIIYPRAEEQNGGVQSATSQVSTKGLANIELHVSRYGCGSKIRAQNGTVVKGNVDRNLRSPGGLILTHTHMFKVN